MLIVGPLPMVDPVVFVPDALAGSAGGASTGDTGVITGSKGLPYLLMPVKFVFPFFAPVLIVEIVVAF